MDSLVSVGALPQAVVAPGQALGFLPSASGIEQASSAGVPGGNTFATMVSDGLQKVNEQLASSQTDLQRLAVGDAQNLHQIMIQLEETRMSFQLMMQVRNRLLEAYQDIMKMPI